MQPNVITSHLASRAASQLGQYQSRSNYDYGGTASSFRTNPRLMTNGGDTPHLPSFHNFTGGTNPSSIMPKNVNAANICNISDTVQILHPIPIARHIKFRKLPFFKLRKEILKPSILGPNSHSSLPASMKTTATQEFQFAFVMTCAMASELSMNRDITKAEYSVQAQLRITVVDNKSPGNTIEHDDFLPLALIIRVNGRQCTSLPPYAPCSRQDQDSRRIPRPISVTHMMKLSPMNANVLTVNWAPEPGKEFIITMNIVEKLSSEFLLNCLKEKPRIPTDVTRVTIRKQYRPIDNDDINMDRAVDDEDIATTIVRVSLLCPLAKFRMQYPAKGKDCTHLQCFDGSAYISLNEKKPMWNCPVCNKCLRYDDLLLDEYFMNVIQNEELSPDCQEVQLFVDGTWKSYFEDLPGDSSDSDAKKGNSSTSSTEKKQCAEESTKHSVSSTSESVADGVGPNCDVVNLLSDDEDDCNTDNATNVFEDTKATTLVTNYADKAVPRAADKDKTSSEMEAIKDDNMTEESHTSNSNEAGTKEVLRTLPATTPDTSSTTIANVKGHRASGVISLDSPSPPSLAKPS